MAEVTLSIGGFSYRMACRDGDEANLLSLGALVDERVQRAKSAVSNSTETRQLLMAAIFLADELQDLKNAPADVIDPTLAEGIASRLEALATKLETLDGNA